MFKNKEGKVRSGWKIAAVLAIILATTTILGAIIGVIAGSYLMATGDMTVKSITDVTYTPRGTQIMGVVNALGMLIQEIVFIIVTLMAWRLVQKRKLSEMGLPALKSHGKELAIGLVAGIVSITAVFGALVITGQARVENWTPHFVSNQLVYVFIFIFVGFAEEIFGRGYVMSVLRQTKSIPVVLLVSAVIFALLHSANSGVGPLAYINLTLFGLFAAYIYLRSGNIWMCIGYHITWNYFQGYVFGFKVSGTDTQGMLSTVFPKDSVLNGGAFGPEGGLFVTVVLLLGILFVKYYYRNSQFDFMAVDKAAEIPQLTPSYDAAAMESTEEAASESTKQESEK